MLKNLPVANLNQVKDTKVLKVISKWAKKPSLSCGPEEETSSSDVDSRELSPPGAADDASRRESHISSSSDELQSSSKGVEAQKSKDSDSSKTDIDCKTADDGDKTTELSPIDDSVFEPGEIRSDEELKPEELNSGELKPETQNSEGPNSEELKPVELKSVELKPARVKVPHSRVFSRIIDRVGDSSEEESRWSEDDAVSSDSEGIVDLAADLLDQWSSLKVRPVTETF